MPVNRRHGSKSYNKEWHISKGDFDIIMQAEDHSAEIVEAIKTAIVRALYRIGLECESYAKDLCHVITGRLRNSITFDIDAGENCTYIGTNVGMRNLRKRAQASGKRTRFYVPPLRTTLTSGSELLKMNWRMAVK